MDKDRVLILDLWRALGVVLMLLFHLIYDLHYFQYVQVDTASIPFFIHLRTFIVTIFMSAVGMSLTIVYSKPFELRKYLGRLLLLGTVSLLISVVTFLLFPQTWIYFGVLHMILAASAVGPWFVKSPRLSGVLGVMIILGYTCDLFTMHPLFTSLQPLLHLPAHHTEDLAPFIPWFGVVLIGIFIMHHARLQLVTSPRTDSLQKIAWIGRNALLIYLLHQPILFIIISGIPYLFF